MRMIYLITFIASFLAFWILGDVVLYLTLIGVVGTFIILKGFRRHPFIYLELIILSIYLIAVFCCLIFVHIRTLKVFLVVIGCWFIITIFFNKRLY
ncbi:MAG TPA: hypothetical protein GXZ48_06485 [Acholeplasmataceae bacterium]|jgi:hypothetical protein|nr:hypothetical protein [Acholeplasmataceae bacterium]